MRGTISFGATVMLCAAAHADIVGVSATFVDFSNGYVFADGTIHEESAHLVPDARPPGTDTYRIWVHLESATDRFAFLGASADDGVMFKFEADGNCTTAVLYNSALGTDIDAPNATLFTVLPELAYDSWLTIGHDGGPSTTAGTSIADDGWVETWAAGDPFASANGGIFDSSPSDGEDVVNGGFSGYRVLIGQVTIADGGTFCLQGRLGGTGGASFDFQLGCYLIFYGACCLSDGTCDLMQGTQSAGFCRGHGGVFQQQTCCEDIECPPVLGACCIESEPCTMQEPETCALIGGTYLGDQVICRCPADVAASTSGPYFGFADRVVDIADLLAVINNFGTDIERFDFAPVNPNGPNGNGIVNIDEILGVLNAFGSCSSVCEVQ
ncbi:MAG: hypothetical protein AAF432_16020 [Planctomycetota bacterium]